MAAKPKQPRSTLTGTAAKNRDYQNSLREAKRLRNQRHEEHVVKLAAGHHSVLSQVLANPGARLRPNPYL